MSPDPSCYEERYRLTGKAALGLTVGLGSVVPGALWRSSGISAAGLILAAPAIFSAITVMLAMPVMVAVVRRMIAFRVDCAGVTLGAVPDNLTFFVRRAVFVPWAEVEQIVLCSAYLQRQGVRGPVQRIKLQCREGAVAIGPGAPACLARRITAWRLDADRLAAVTAVVAPGIPVIDASACSV